MKTFIHNDWQEVLGPQFESAYYAHLHNFLKSEYQHYTIHPDMYHIFRGHRMRNTIKRRLFPGIAAEVSSSADRFDFHSFDRVHNIRWKANDLRHRCGADPCRIADIHTYVRFHPHIMQRQAAANTAYGIQ